MYRFALLGDKVDYSRSPEIFRAIFKCAQVDGSFEIVNCSTDGIAEQVSRMRSEGYLALSVTIPHKESIIQHLDEVDSVASAIRSVNSIRIDSEKLVGLNTDVYGFRQELQSYSGLLKGKRAIIFGAGGAARSAAYALALEFEMAEICFVARNSERLQETVTTLSQVLSNSLFSSRSIDSLSTLVDQSSVGDNVASNYQLVVNATPLGGPNLRDVTGSSFSNAPKLGRIYYDLNYNDDNALIRTARESGVVAIHGLPMLIHQALRSFHLWCGLNVEYSAVVDALGE